MATGRISKRSVDTAHPGDRDTYLWDSELPGFGLKVTPAGGRTYLVQYRLGGRRGRTRRVTIGRHGPITPDEARDEAKRLLGEVAAGNDPAVERRQARKAITIDVLCDLYLAEGVATKKATTVMMDRGRIERHVKPLLGRRRARDVAQADVERFMNAVASRAGKSAASRTVGMLGGIFSFAVSRGVRADTPVRGVKRFPDRKVERFLSPAELTQLGEALAAAERGGVNSYAVAALRMLVITGCRSAEVLGLQWRDVDWQHSCLRLPDSKTGAKVVPLGAPAVELLKSLPQIEGNPYVFPGAKEGGHLVGIQKVWRRIRTHAGLPGVRVHDLRHSFAAVGASGGDSLLIIGKLLGHRNAASTSRYAHLSDDPLRTAADRIAGQIAAAMNGDQGELVELPKRSP